MTPCTGAIPSIPEPGLGAATSFDLFDPVGANPGSPRDGAFGEASVEGLADGVPVGLFGVACALAGTVESLFGESDLFGVVCECGQVFAHSTEGSSGLLPSVGNGKHFGEGRGRIPQSQKHEGDAGHWSKQW